MREILAFGPATLGEKLDGGRAATLRTALLRLLSFALLVCATTLALSWAFLRPDIEKTPVLMLLAVLIGAWLYVQGKLRGHGRHFLLSNDRQGFVSGLRLDEKTAVFDGSNLLHFGINNGLDAQPLGEIADRLRHEGYRIVCFFDANIFYTLGEHGAFPKGKKHSLAMLETFFGLKPNEIYVVPSGVQADRYILECLEHLPISFAVTNDRFKDYASQYPTVMKDNLWRKGVVVSDGEIKLLQHQFQDA